MTSSTTRRGISGALLRVAFLVTTTVGLRAAAEEETSYGTQLTAQEKADLSAFMRAL